MALMEPDSSSVKDKEDLGYLEHAQVPRKHRTPVERQQALKAALEIDPGVTRWSSRAIQVWFSSGIAESALNF